MHKIFSIILMVTIFICTIANHATSQDKRPTTQDDLVLIDRLINSDKIEVYLTKNSAVDQRARSCAKLSTTAKGIGFYRTSNSSVELKLNQLKVTTGRGMGEVVEDYGKGDYSHCFKKTIARTTNLKTVTHDNIPILISGTLENDVCYLQALYTDCTSKCVASATAGSSLFYIVVSKSFAESVSKATCK